MVKDFWENKLGEIWPIFVPNDLRQAGREDYLRQLDKIFESAIHRQFTDVSASGEAAELWRRVFYDFRKLHHYVYQNGFAQTILELAESPGVRYDSLLNFLKSGLLPGGGGKWSGVLGQSMTAPLFFILRELRRLEVIDVRFARSCFYMNSPARQIARKLGWLSERESGFYDIERLSQIGDICFGSMRDEMTELLPYFDLPLQWYASKNPS